MGLCSIHGEAINTTSIFISGEIHSSKNSRRILRTGAGVPFIAKSKSAKDDEYSFSLQLSCGKWAWDEMVLGKEYPLRIVFEFHRATKRRFDYVNLAQGILDAMVKAEYIPDDNADFVIPVFVPYLIDKKEPGCRIWVE